MNRFALMLLCLISVGISSSVLAQQQNTNINTGGTTVHSRVNPPEGFIRTPLPSFSYQAYLQSLAIKNADAKVMRFDGNEKKFECYSAVLDVELLDKDLMHGEHYIQLLRANYLFNHSKYDMISFHYDDNRSLSYAQWADGYRYVWQDSLYVLDSIAIPNSSEVSFIKYMNEIYENSTAIGLSHDTELLEVSKLSIGDVLVQPEDLDHKGHAVLVLDMVVNPETGEKLYLFAQGYMPAQNMHILHNPYEPEISPWFRVQEDALYVATPQWTFRKKHVRRFKINANASNLLESLEDLVEGD